MNDYLNSMDFFYIYCLGFLASYIYWGINHGGGKEVRIKHLLLGWFNHFDIDHNKDAFVQVCLWIATLIWPITLCFILFGYCLFYLIVALIYVCNKTKITYIFNKFINIKIRG